MSKKLAETTENSDAGSSHHQNRPLFHFSESLSCDNLSECTNPPTLFLHLTMSFPVFSSSDSHSDIQTQQKDGELLHSSHLRPQHGRTVGQSWCGNSGHRLPDERKRLSGRRGQEEALSSQVSSPQGHTSDPTRCVFSPLVNYKKHACFALNLHISDSLQCFCTAESNWAKSFPLLRAGEYHYQSQVSSALPLTHSMVTLTHPLPSGYTPITLVLYAQAEPSPTPHYISWQSNGFRKQARHK